MKYKKSEHFTHQQAPKTGILITNLGTPKAPTAKALRAYLAEFLSDTRVIELPRWLWMMILHGIILNVRPKKSATAYQKVWTQDGSPLMHFTQAQAQKLQRRFQQSQREDIVVDFAMRYGSPSIAEKIQAMKEAGVRQLLVLPLFPQYSACTTGSTFDALAHDFTQRRWLPDLRFVSHYHDNDVYINTLAERILAFRENHGKSEKLLFSYHGLPLRYLTNGDPYHCECHKTTRLIAEKLGLNKADYDTCFQSRFGREEWLQPYTDETLKQLAKDGVESVQIVCPGFSSDCLETLEEIDQEYRDVFLSAGGKQYHYIPALNDQDDHIEMLYQLVQNHLNGWQIFNMSDGEQTHTHYANHCTSTATDAHHLVN